jgi:hypothetical protein
VAAAVSADDVAGEGLDGPAIGRAIREARIGALREALPRDAG